MEYSIIHSSGKLRGSKTEYRDGIGYTIWFFPSLDVEGGISFSLKEEDISDLIIIIGRLIKAKADPYKEKQ